MIIHDLIKLINLEVVLGKAYIYIYTEIPDFYYGL
jgi:hypothetical protein